MANYKETTIRHTTSKKERAGVSIAEMQNRIVMLCVFLVATLLLCGMANGQVMPYPGDCSKYQHCDVSGCFVLSCGAGTEFNPAINTCDYPLQGRSDCGNRG